MPRHSQMWLAALVTACLAVLAAGQKPIVRLKSGSGYYKVLALDGGGGRLAWAVPVLEQLEQAIREVLVERGLTKFTNPDDFEVLLSDYFDMAAGTSMGLRYAAYLATRAPHPNITATPGSALGFYQYMQDAVLDAIIAPIESKISSGQWAMANYETWAEPSVDMLYKFTLQMFGNRTIQERSAYHMSLMGIVADAQAAAGNSVGVFVDLKTQRSGTYEARLNSHDGNKTHYNRNFNLARVIVASSAIPNRLGPVNLTTIPPTPRSEYFSTYCVDGAIGEQNPSGVTLSYLMKEQKIKPKKVVTLSVGTPFPATRAYNTSQLLAGLSSGNLEILNSLFLTSRHMVSDLVDVVLSNAHDSPTVPPYLRICTIYDATTIGTGKLVTPQAIGKYVNELYASVSPITHERLAALYNAGKDVAAEYKDSIKAFVRAYVVPKKKAGRRLMSRRA